MTEDGAIPHSVGAQVAAEAMPYHSHRRRGCKTRAGPCYTRLRERVSLAAEGNCASGGTRPIAPASIEVGDAL